MEISQLEQACRDTIARGGGGVMLVLPGPPRRNGSRRLSGSRGPIGEVINVNHAGNSVCRFDPHAILRFLARNEG